MTKLNNRKLAFSLCRLMATAVFSLLPQIAISGPIVSCRGQYGTVEFLDIKGRTVKYFTNKEERKERNGFIHYDLVSVYGCRKGRFAYVVRQRGKCLAGDEECGGGKAILEIYDHTGRKTWKEAVALYDKSDVTVARSDERVLVKLLSPPYGIVAIDPHGNKKHIEVLGGLYPNAVSPSGRYAVADVGSDTYIFIDFVSGKTHAYKGRGNPWVNDEGRFEVWEGSSLKDDWSLGPDGKKVYGFTFDD